MQNDFNRLLITSMTKVTDKELCVLYAYNHYNTIFKPSYALEYLKWYKREFRGFLELHEIFQEISHL